MSAVLDDLVSILETAAVGTFATDIFAGGFVDQGGAPDRQLALYETPGMMADYVMGSHPPAAIRPRVQLVARGAPEDYLEARDLAQAAFDAVDNKAGLVVGSTTYVRIEALQPPFDLGRDENNRRLVGFNVQVVRDP